MIRGRGGGGHALFARPCPALSSSCTRGSSGGTYPQWLTTTRALHTATSPQSPHPHPHTQTHTKKTGKRAAIIPSRRYGCAHIAATHADTAVVFASGHTDAECTGVPGVDPAVHHAVRYLSLPEAAFIRFLRGHTAPVTSLALHPANDTLFSAARDDTVRMWDLRSPAAVGLMRVPGSPTVASDRQGLIFAVGVAGGVIKLFDARNYAAGPFCTYAVVSSAQASTAASGAGGPPPPAPGGGGAASTARPAPLGFSDIAFSPAGVLIAAVAGPDVWSLDAFEGVTRTHIHTGGSAVGGGGDGGGGGVDTGSGGAAAAQPLPPARAPPGGQAAFSPDDNYVLSGCANGTIGAWGSGATRSTAGTHAAVWAGGGGQPSVLRWAPTRQCVAAAGGGALALWVPQSSGGAAGA